MSKVKRKCQIYAFLIYCSRPTQHFHTRPKNERPFVVLFFLYYRPTDSSRTKISENKKNQLKWSENTLLLYICNYYRCAIRQIDLTNRGHAVFVILQPILSGLWKHISWTRINKARSKPTNSLRWLNYQYSMKLEKSPDLALPFKAYRYKRGNLSFLISEYNIMIRPLFRFRNWYFRQESFSQCCTGSPEHTFE